MFVGVSLILSPVVSDIPEASAQSGSKMKDQYELQIEAPPKPFGLGARKVSAQLAYLGVPEGTDVQILSPNFSDDGFSENNLVVRTMYPGSLWVQFFPEAYSYSRSVSNTTKYMVTYPDSSREIVQRTVTIHPALRHVLEPELKTKRVETGKGTALAFSDVPRGTKLEILDAPQGWLASVSEGQVTVKPKTAGSGDLVVNFEYRDGSSEVKTFHIAAVRPTPASTTSKTSPSASTKRDAPPMSVVETATPTTTSKMAPKSTPTTLTVTETANPVTKTITEKANPETSTVIETVTVPSTVTEHAEPAITTVTATQAAPAPSTVTVTQAAPSPLTVTSAVTEKAKPARPATETVTKTVEAPESAATVTLTEKAEAEVVTTTVVEPASPSTETVTVTESSEAATVTLSLIHI